MGRRYGEDPLRDVEDSITDELWKTRMVLEEILAHMIAVSSYHMTAAGYDADQAAAVLTKSRKKVAEMFDE